MMGLEMVEAEMLTTKNHCHYMNQMRSDPNKGPRKIGLKPGQIFFFFLALISSTMAKKCFLVNMSPSSWSPNVTYLWYNFTYQKS